MQSASLAIMAKIEQLYEAVTERDDAFLSFIPIALPFDADALSKAADGLAGDDALAALEASADFAILANYIPPVAEIWSQDGRLLWEVYERVLSDARLAAPALTEGEKRRLQEARDLLSDSVTGEPTPKFLRYLELQSAFLKAKERHAAAMLTAENSTDPAVIAEWQAKEEGLRAEVEAALVDWRTSGAKDAIEEALAVDAHLSGLNPAVRFAEARDRLERAKRNALGAGTGTFFDTAYLPREMFAPQTVWTTIELDASEIATLTSGADEAAGAAGGGEAGSGVTAAIGEGAGGEETAEDDDLEIERLSVEIGRADVLRDWFDVDLLTSRSWQWRFDSPALSDGGDPPQGAMPAFVTAMLFVRNLEVQLKSNSIKNHALVAEMQAGRPMMIGNIVLQQVASTVDASNVTTLTSAKAGLQAHSIAALTAKMVEPLDDAPQVGEDGSGASSSGAAPTFHLSRARPATFLAGRLSAATPPSVPPAAPAVTPPAASFRAGSAALSAAARVARVTRPAVRDHRGSTSGRPAVRDHRTGAGRRPVVRDHRTGTEGRPVVRDHRTGDGGRPHVRDHRAGASSRPKVRDHRLSWGRSRLEDLLGKDRIVVRVPSGRSKSGVSGTVTTTGAGGASGGPLEGARITFSDASDKPVSSVVTDAAGAYRARLAPGHYRVSAVFEGFEEFAAAEPVAVRQDATTDLDIQLAPVVAAPEVHRQPGIQLIAVLCRELPKAPNPDPNLDWS